MRPTTFRLAFCTVCALLFGFEPNLVNADGITIYVGYADSLRPNAFFPSPWNGSPNTIFLGSKTPGTIFDAGAILIQNTSGSAVTINDVFVSGFQNGATYDLWGTPGLLPNGDYMVLTQTTTNASQFDTSDQLTRFSYPDGSSGFTPAHPYTGDPMVRVKIDGTAQTFSDTGHILDTGGYDAATYGINGSNYPYNPSKFPENESLQWRPIGTTGVGNPGGNPPTPEPGTLTLGVLGILTFGLVFARSRGRASRMRSEEGPAPVRRSREA